MFSISHKSTFISNDLTSSQSEFSSCNKWDICCLFFVCFFPDRVHPCDVGGDAGEDSGLLGRVASHTRHKAGYPMDIPMVVNCAAERATKVTLGSNENKCLLNVHRYILRHIAFFVLLTVFCCRKLGGFLADILGGGGMIFSTGASLFCNLHWYWWGWVCTFKVVKRLWFLKSHNQLWPILLGFA